MFLCKPSVVEGNRHDSLSCLCSRFDAHRVCQTEHKTFPSRVFVSFLGAVSAALTPIAACCSKSYMVGHRRVPKSASGRPGRSQSTSQARPKHVVHLSSPISATRLALISQKCDCSLNSQIIRNSVIRSNRPSTYKSNLKLLNFKKNLVV